MLERVKDFRYEEIKNWKPIVSLRESYRRENSLRTFSLVPICILAIVMAYALLSGWVKFSDAPIDGTPQLSSSTSASTTQGSLQKPSTLQKQPSLQDPNRNLPTSLATQSTLSNNGAALISATPNSASNRQASAYSSTTQLRIGVCNTETLARDLISRVKYSWEAENTATLTEDQRKMMNVVADLSTTEVGIVKKIFEQKKRITEFEIKFGTKELLDKFEDEIKPMIIAVGQENDFDIIVPSRSVLAYDNAIDVTHLVHQKMQQANDAIVNYSNPNSQNNTARGVNSNRFNR